MCRPCFAGPVSRLEYMGGGGGGVFLETSIWTVSASRHKVHLRGLLFMRAASFVGIYTQTPGRI